MVFLDIEWQETLQLTLHDVNHAMESLFAKINTLVDQYMPLKKISQKEYKRKFKPWVSDNILSRIKYKENIYHEYLKCENIEQKEKIITDYKEQKNQITELIRTGKKDYYEKYFTENRKNLKKIWKGIKEVINIKSNKSAMLGL